MKNEFTQKTKDLFDDVYMDWDDGQSDVDCLHHILGRVSNSPYNAAPLSNFRTHLPEWRAKNNRPHIHSFEVQQKFLLKTKKYLDKINYKPTEVDLSFLEQNKKYYEI